MTDHFALIDFLVNGVLFWLAIGLFILQAYNVLFHKGIPNIRTAPAIREKLIALLKEDFEARGENPYTIIDLGSGNGHLTREIAKALPQARVIGLEIARLSLTWANWRKKLARLENLTYKRTNFLAYDLSEASAVVMYLIPPLMKPVGEKLHKEARSGTLVLSNKFQLGDGWIPEDTLRVKTLYLHQGNLHIYRKS